MRARPLDVRIGGPGLRVCAAHVSRKNPNIVSPRRVHGVVRGLCSSVGASCAGSIRGRPLRISRHQFWTQTIGLSMDRLCTVFCSLSLGRHHLDAALHRRNSHLSESSIFCIVLRNVLHRRQNRSPLLSSRENRRRFRRAVLLVDFTSFTLQYHRTRQVFPVRCRHSLTRFPVCSVRSAGPRGLFTAQP